MEERDESERGMKVREGGGRVRRVGKRMKGGREGRDKTVSNIETVV